MSALSYAYRRTRYDDDVIIAQIIKLADANRKTLGFIPAGAIKERCQNGNAFVCMQEDKLVGYILFASLKRKYIVKIIHFCISKECRRGNLGLTLFQEFKKIIKNSYYIELSCRDDYKINSFWHRLGFDIVKAKEGRATNSLSILHQFRYKLQDDFHNILDEYEHRPKVQLDSSIIFSLNFESQVFTYENSLLAFSNDVIFCIAPVVYEDMQKQKNNELKLESIKKANRFVVLSVSKNEYLNLLADIECKFPKISESDRKQIACAIANNINYFVTKDNQLLGYFKEFADAYQMLIHSPAEFYSHFDSIINRERNYSFLPTAHGKLVDITLNEAEMCEYYLNHATGETKQKFLDKFLKNIHNSSLKSILINNKVVGVLFYTINNMTMCIHVLRLRKSEHNTVYDISSFIIRELIQFSAQRDVHLIKLCDDGVHTKTKLAVNDLGFTKNQKLSVQYVGSTKCFSNFLSKKHVETDAQEFSEILNAYDIKQDNYYLSGLEKQYFPVKFSDIDIPAYIIPINPQWAKDLLTPDVEDQHSLIESKKSNVLLPIASVYFSSKKQSINAPARVLWYISKGRQTQNSASKWKGYIIASSYIDEVVVGSKSEIFKKFWRLGVYEWKDISKGLSNSCTAIVFSGTEVFNTKVPYEDVKKTVSDNMQKGITLVSVVKITSEVFLSLYEKGFSCERFE